MNNKLDQVLENIRGERVESLSPRYVHNMSIDDAISWVKEYAPSIHKHIKEMSQELAKAKAKGINDPDLLDALYVAIKAVTEAQLILNQANGVAMMLKHGEKGKKRAMGLAQSLLSKLSR